MKLFTYVLFTFVYESDMIEFLKIRFGDQSWVRKRKRRWWRKGRVFAQSSTRAKSLTPFTAATPKDPPRKKLKCFSPGENAKGRGGGGRLIT